MKKKLWRRVQVALVVFAVCLVIAVLPLVVLTGGMAATVIIEAQNGGEKWKTKWQWCLFWAYHVRDSLELEWLDDETLKVTETKEQVSFELPIYADQTEWMPSYYN